MNIDVVKKAGISDKPKAMKTNLCKFSGALEHMEHVASETLIIVILAVAKFSNNELLLPLQLLQDEQFLALVAGVAQVPKI